MKTSFDCHYFQQRVCRSCDLLSIPAQNRSETKDAILREALLAFHPESLEILPWQRPTPTEGSRNKAKFQFGGTWQNPVLGFTDASQVVHAVPECPLHAPILNLIAQHVVSKVQELRIPIYNLANRTGELKGLMLRTNDSMSDVSVRLVTRSWDTRNSIDRLAKDLVNRFQEICSVSVNIQPIHQAVLEGPEELTLRATRAFSQTIGNRRFQFSGSSFSQINWEMTHSLSRSLMGRLTESTSENPDQRTLLDLYCGVGIFSILASPHFKRTIGVELNPKSIEDAQRNAALNKCSNRTEFVAGDVEEFLRSTLDSIQDLTHVVVNPPRRGLSPEIINLLVDKKPLQILYSSCNPLSLARDLTLFQPNYTIRSIEPFDMFPMTRHMELLVQLQRK